VHRVPGVLCAAAQELLAGFLPADDPEAIELRAIVARTAEELNRPNLK
jgi:hypothetical protein